MRVDMPCPKPHVATYTASTVAAVVGLVVAITASPTHATTFDPLSVEALMARSDVVIHGRVEVVETRLAGPSGQLGLHTRVVVRVEEALLGQPARSTELWVQGGRTADRVRVVHGQAHFVVGEEVLLFLFEGGGGLWPTAMSRGKWTRHSRRGFEPTSPLDPDGPATPPISIPSLRQLSRSARGTR